MPDTTPVSKLYLKKRQVQQRYGDRSATWIKRQQEKYDFPQAAMYVGNSPLWLLADLDAWDAVQAAKPKPKLNRDMVAIRAAREVQP
ncbi:MAG TPA: hypothetical protein VHQ48_07080 [Bradyrhizobium sp.]|jgi:hypothetical protein|nr:hypothetical protein [Bradyrhizobium sp.]